MNVRDGRYGSEGMMRVFSRDGVENAAADVMARPVPVRAEGIAAAAATATRGMLMIRRMLHSTTIVAVGH